MIGALPKSLTVNGKEYAINSDFRAALLIFEAFSDVSLSKFNRQLVMLEILYTPIGGNRPIIPNNMNEAIKQAVWFLDVGMDRKHDGNEPKTIDYAQDEQHLFSAVNAVAKDDIREREYLHWWTFYGLCQAISSDSLISHICNIRSKKAKHEKLEKHEDKFYKENRHLIDFRTGIDAYEDMVRKLRR